jgi:uncharacterized protein DUF4337
MSGHGAGRRLSRLVASRRAPQGDGKQTGAKMPEAHESLEHAEHAEHASHSNRKVALVIAILALFLSFSEMLGKSAQTEAIGENVTASNLWSFFQAKTVRQTVIRTFAEEMKLTAETATDPATKATMEKQIEAWQKTVARYESEPETHEGRKELSHRAKEAEESRDTLLAKYHAYEIASAAFQIGIVLASAAVITEIVALAWLAGVLGAGGLVIMVIGFFAPHLLHHV